MARLIRERDWSDHPLGLPETWPQSLRSALSICLHSAFPTAIYWGSNLHLLYNDAWSAIPGPRHPNCLGAPAHEVWSDIWHIIAPQFIGLVDTGEGIFVEDQLLPMQRYGLPEETYWNYSFTPIRGEDGSVVGVFNTG
ncbi:MAG: PAS domain-containing protein, partial [Alphaproteobacteria bacterium]|nr:PAS domain-containing protein [Alphaproteobacteria bacterium]